MKKFIIASMFALGLTLPALPAAAWDNNGHDGHDDHGNRGGPARIVEARHDERWANDRYRGNPHYYPAPRPVYNPPRYVYVQPPVYQPVYYVPRPVAYNYVAPWPDSFTSIFLRF